MSKMQEYNQKLDFARSLSSFKVGILSFKFANKKTTNNADKSCKKRTNHVIYTYLHHFKTDAIIDKFVTQLSKNPIPYWQMLMAYDVKPTSIKIVTKTLDEIKEIYDKNSVLFATINQKLAEQKLIKEIESI